MQISILLTSLLLLSVSFPFSAARGFEPCPVPVYFDGSPVGEFPASEPDSSGSGDGLSPLMSPAFVESPPPEMVAPVGNEGEEDVAPAPKEYESQSFGEIPPSIPEPEDAGEGMVRWCAVREKYEDCQLLVSVLAQSDGYTWKCVKKETVEECLHSIKEGKADITNLEAGMAYTAFINHSMKAIANEVYCDRAHSYEAVAVVSRKACMNNNEISILDFKGHKSCHGGYSTAAGWNYPINQVKQESYNSSKGMNDREVATRFFSEVCAPSEFDGAGVCGGCSNENGSCHSSSLYLGDSGAFRCLVEELGDVAFVRGDTALLYSMEGPHNQSWSAKSVRDFMYLCPQGGCREINGYPGSCSFGAVPADVIMASNSIPNKKRLLVLKTLKNVTLIDALIAGRNGATNYLLSPSTQELTVVKKLTRSYLGKSASISKSLQELSNPDNEAVQSTVNSVSASQPSSFHQSLPVITLFSVLLVLVVQFN
ncbi:hypothetical protein SLA2020_422150 [Shorea laevis]